MIEVTAGLPSETVRDRTRARAATLAERHRFHGLLLVRGIDAVHIRTSVSIRCLIGVFRVDWSKRTNRASVVIYMY